MVSNKIQKLVDEIFDFVEENGKSSLLNSSNVTLPKDQLYYLLDELNNTVPQELERFQKTYNQRDAIIKDAERKAAEIISKAEEKAKRMVHQNSIVKDAYTQADIIVKEASMTAEETMNQAQDQAYTIRDGAFHYANEQLSMIENVLSAALDSADRQYESLFNSIQSQYDALMDDLNEHLKTVTKNRSELNISTTPSNDYTAAYETETENTDLPEIEMPPINE